MVHAALEETARRVRGASASDVTVRRAVTKGCGVRGDGVQRRRRRQQVKRVAVARQRRRHLRALLGEGAAVDVRVVRVHRRGAIVRLQHPLHDVFVELRCVLLHRSAVRIIQRVQDVAARADIVCPNTHNARQTCHTERTER
jgi:hypothetical protein